MNTDQITKILKNDPESKKIFQKVCALDQLEIPTYPSAYVVNSDPKHEPGEHWVAIYFDRNRRGEYFDSYGLPPSILGLNSYMDDFSSSWIYNQKTLQALFSNVCGQYCVYFILLRSRGLSLHAIVSRFTSQASENDVYVSRVIENL